jgi:hypothetical protein
MCPVCGGRTQLRRHTLTGRVRRSVAAESLAQAGRGLRQITHCSHIRLQIPPDRLHLLTQSCQNDQVIDMLQENPLVLPLVPEEAVQGPPAGSLDNVGWDATCKQLGCTANAEAVASDLYKVVHQHNGVDLSKEELLGQRPGHPGNRVCE